MATNIYGRPMFNGGTIRTAPRRFQEGGVVHPAFYSEYWNPVLKSLGEKGVAALNIDPETGAFINPRAALERLSKLAHKGEDIRPFLSQDSSSQFHSVQDEQLRKVSPAGDRYKELLRPLTPSGKSRKTAREINEGISQYYHQKVGKTPEYEFSEEIIVEPKPERVPTPIPKPQSFNKGGPIRRQAGGGIEAVMPGDLGALVEQPPMPIAAPPPVEEALPRVEQAAANVAEEEVGNYAANMMSGLDAAEESGDPEDAINALRGNELPISERYEELATYVGEDDAERTPESVLLMVQPTIMLTEQGAMDSGIGSLMQDLVGEVEMETDVGTPTPMGEGVGSLMMAQGPTDMEVGQEPPVNFNYGGPVQRFSGENGISEVRSLKSIYEEKLPL